MLDSVYDAAVHADGWRPALDGLGALFNSHFVDLFARTTDWSEYRGLAVGLDKADYEGRFLGQWSSRNVWSQASPSAFTGEVKPTWQMVDKSDVLKSAIYNEYLKPRQLNEGLRLVLWSGEGWMQDISLLRPWAAGPFDSGEIRLARTLLPHLQRASAMSRDLRGVEALALFDTLDRPAFLLDSRGKLIRYNAAGEPLLQMEGGLVVRAGYLEAACIEDTVFLGAAVARAGCIGHRAPQASALTVGPDAIALTVLPVRDRARQDLPAPRSVLVLGAPIRLRLPITEAELMTAYALTPAEATLACGLLAGQALSAIAAERGRSVNTLRAQLARIMTKTNTRRQGELLLLLSQLG